MIVETILSSLGKFAAAKLPPILARRFFPPSIITKQLDVQLRRQNPIEFGRGATIPYLRVWFEVRNASLIDVTLERLLAEVWVGQPVLYQAATLRRQLIPKHGSIDTVSIWAELTPQVHKAIEFQTRDGVLTLPVTLHVHAYFESKAGLLDSGMLTLEARDVLFR